ncbi:MULTISPECIES: oxidoreductase [Carnobacterium]|uniref:oxidoreductase n=1 Tax=Carnobacterium TaxID=2747 RepID=UPI0028922F33|nr:MULTISPECIES: FAD-dependent oxidoreductase [Carnobacterium]MDT1940836.1 NAD(P)/FAD-dependent oxidoreductase [Carnobacterium divergens]MDT1943275.1 NAD(P)/FAD-dependent oxidoreductase [Carnobacterium divergens]MDT1949081.1 NAD(P)/FAD-dependent oxidoreductase [Carnobacterium divergens]MDT1951565.1 NAD(P)/FAD-dependent oxidoreductase [Carnobacterium divergens]MDT1956740.1 NAD(P)/FAD-dependent oxidoreductase [Carnobacterium divergens]
MENYEAIFEPLTVKRMTIKNRVIMPPMGTNFANMDGSFNNEHITYYEQRAKGGTGLITLENACIDYPMGTNGTTQLRIDNDQYLPGLWKFNEVMHSYGACTSVQINHAGASAYGLRLEGKQAVSASNIPSKKGNAVPRPLLKEEILEIVKKYGEAANRAQRAGFDCVEIHAGHSYLVSQFLSPLYNQRTDEFGGSPENRSRFAKLIVEEVRRAVGPHYPICLRFSGDELLEGGNTLEDTLDLLTYFVEEIDILNVSAALNDSIQYQIDQMNLADGWRSYMAKAVKEKFGKVTITSGNIRSPKIANDILLKGDADLLAMGRGLIAEPNWVNKVKNGEEQLLRKCISCNIGCADHRIAKSRPLRCTVNPDVIYEDAYKEHQVKNHLKMVVIGGGTAALEAATTAAEVGVEVIVFEAKAYLGGLAHEIARLPDKRRIDDYVIYLKERAKQLPNLTIHLQTKATVEMIEKIKPDIVVNATGAKPLLPPIKGLQEQLENPNRKVFSIFDLLNNMENFQEFTGKRIAVIGGGAVGLDVVEYYAERHAESVSIVEMQPTLGKDLDMITRISMMDIIQRHGVATYTETALTQVNEASFTVMQQGEEVDIPFDLGFVCLGMKAERPLMEPLMSYQKESGATVVNLGDSKVARRIYEGTKEARDILTTVHQVDREKGRQSLKHYSYQ